MALSKNFEIMQERLEQPPCFGKYGKPKKGLKCGLCWFWPKCKDNKPARKKVESKKVEESVDSPKVDE